MQYTFQWEQATYFRFLIHPLKTNNELFLFVCWKKLNPTFSAYIRMNTNLKIFINESNQRALRLGLYDLFHAKAPKCVLWPNDFWPEINLYHTYSNKLLNRIHLYHISNNDFEPVHLKLFNPCFSIENGVVLKKTFRIKTIDIPYHLRINA